MLTLIPENDETITAEFVQVERHGELMRAYYAAPKSRKMPSQGIVLAMHLYGIDASTRNTARQFAREGFSVIVPDLYARFEAPSGDGCNDPSLFFPFARKLTFDTVEPDLRASATWLRDKCQTEKIAIAGFCMGGIVALYRTAGYADIFSAAAVWYGSIERSKADPSAADIPIVGSFGGADHGIPVDDVDTFRSRLTVPNDILVYPGVGHAFADRSRPSFHAEAAEDSFRRSVVFLREHLV